MKRNALSPTKIEFPVTDASLVFGLIENRYLEVFEASTATVVFISVVVAVVVVLLWFDFDGVNKLIIPQFLYIDTCRNNERKLLWK